MSSTQSYDFIIIGSGFGGSVSALRLAEKGYRVAVVEQGRRYRPEDFPKTNWNLRKYLWMPRLFLYGIQAMTLMKDVFILHGVGVGGGSLVYANNLLVPPDEVFDEPQWGGSGWREHLAPYYAKARTTLGSTPHTVLTSADEHLQACATEDGRGDTFSFNEVGVYFGEPGETVPDPYFDGEGPERTGCTLCGGCMVGCRVGAKNTLDQNYLYLAERLGVDVLPETRVTDVRPATGGGYEVAGIKLTGLFYHKRIRLQAPNVVFSAGTLGTVKLLNQCRAKGSLIGLSPKLGQYVRTNSEALLGIEARKYDTDYSSGLAITSSVKPDDDTTVETVRYAKGQNLMYLLGTVLTGGGPPWPRQLRFLANVVRHPLHFLKGLWPFGRATRGTILLVMQKIDNWLQVDYKRRWWRLGGRSLNSNWHTPRPVPSYIPLANNYARRMAKKVGGDAYSVLPEVLFDTSSTAHILGGCVMGKTPEQGVIDFQGRVFGHEGLYVVDGSIVPVNLGVNPSLTITALAEYIMDQIPVKNAT